jgi:hypothetical protein
MALVNLMNNSRNVSLRSAAIFDQPPYGYEKLLFIKINKIKRFITMEGTKKQYLPEKFKEV